MDFIMILFVFGLLMIVSLVLNILFKTTKKRDWIISFSLSIILSFIIVGVLGVK